MGLRDPYCRNCEAVTGGDCGRHGPEFYQVGEAIGGDDAVASLRAQLADRDRRLGEIREAANLWHLCGGQRVAGVRAVDDAITALLDAARRE